MNVFEWAASVWSQGPQAGAIDVVVVRKKDGALSCSPFHVRFNKVAKRGDPRVVHMKVNSKDVGLSMKLGRAGEAFFVERARNRLVREGAWGPPSPTRKSPTDYADVGPGSRTVVEEPEGNPMSDVINRRRQRSMSEGDYIDELKALTVAATSSTAGGNSESLKSDIRDAIIEDAVLEQLTAGALARIRHRSYSDMSAAVSHSSLVAAGDKSLRPEDTLSRISRGSARGSSDSLHHFHDVGASDADAFDSQRGGLRPSGKIKNVSSIKKPMFSQTSPSERKGAQAQLPHSFGSLEWKSATTHSSNSPVPPLPSWTWTWGDLPVKEKHRTTPRISSRSPAGDMEYRQDDDDERQERQEVGRSAAHSNRSADVKYGRRMYSKATRHRLVEAHSVADLPFAEAPTAKVAGIGAEAEVEVEVEHAPDDKHKLHCSDASSLMEYRPDDRSADASSLSACPSLPALRDASSMDMSHHSIHVDVHLNLAAGKDDIDAHTPPVTTDSVHMHRDDASDYAPGLYDEEQYSVTPTSSPLPVLYSSNSGDALHGGGDQSNNDSVSRVIHRVENTSSSYSGVISIGDLADFFVPTGTHRMFSLCGHVLSRESGAPEPVPQSATTLLEVLQSYRLKAQDMSTSVPSVAILEDPHIVVVVDDFLLPMPVAKILLDDLRPQLNGRSLRSVEILDEFCGSATATEELVRAAMAKFTRGDAVMGGRRCASTDIDSFVGLPVWAGKRISTWALDAPNEDGAEHLRLPSHDIADALVDRRLAAVSRQDEGDKLNILQDNDFASAGKSPAPAVTTSSSKSNSRVATPARVAPVGKPQALPTPPPIRVFPRPFDAGLSATLGVNPGLGAAVMTNIPTTGISIAGASSSKHNWDLNFPEPSLIGGGEEGVDPSRSLLSTLKATPWKEPFPPSSRVSSDGISGISPSTDPVPPIAVPTDPLALRRNNNSDMWRWEADDASEDNRAEPISHSVSESIDDHGVVSHSVHSARTIDDSQHSAGYHLARPLPDLDTPFSSVLGRSYPTSSTSASSTLGVSRVARDAAVQALKSDSLNMSDKSDKTEKAGVRYLKSKDDANPNPSSNSMLDGKHEYFSEGEDEGDTDHDHLSLEDIPLEEISPEPAGGDFYDSDTDSYLSASLDDGEPGPAASAANRTRKYRYRRVLVPPQEHLQQLELQHGENEVTFEVGGCPAVRSQLFVWPADARVVIIDIEGAITSVTESKGWGSFLSVSKNIIHKGVAKLLNGIYRNGYYVLYIAQSIRSSSGTATAASKGHLEKVAAGSDVKLPPGPIFQSPESLIRAFGADRTDLFKAAALRGLKGLFSANHNPYYASFGTRQSDAVAFSRCGVPEGRNFLVSGGSGEIRGSGANKTFRRSYEEMYADLHMIFPDISDPCLKTTSVPTARTITPDVASGSAADSKSERSTLSPGLAGGSGSTTAASSSPLAAAVTSSSAASEPTRTSASATATQVTTSIKVSSTSAPVDDAYSDLNYWRVPLPQINLPSLPDPKKKK